MSHFGLMATYAFLVALFFAILWKRNRREKTKLFLQLFLGMIGGALVIAWLMYMLPSAPPAPIP